MNWTCDGNAISTRLTRDHDFGHPFVSAGTGFVAHAAQLADAGVELGVGGMVHAARIPGAGLDVEIRPVLDLGGLEP